MALVLTTPARLGLLCIWLFTWGEALTGGIWYLLGFLVMPYTTLFYMMASAENGNWILGWLLIAAGVFLDFVAILVILYAFGQQAREV